MVKSIKGFCYCYLLLYLIKIVSHAEKTGNFFLIKWIVIDSNLISATHNLRVTAYITFEGSFIWMSEFHMLLKSRSIWAGHVTKLTLHIVNYKTKKWKKKTLSVSLIVTLRIGILVCPSCDILEFPNSNLIKDKLDKEQSTGRAMAATESLLVFIYWDNFVTYHGAACDLVICVLSRNALNSVSTGNFHL